MCPRIKKPSKIIDLLQHIPTVTFTVCCPPSMNRAYLLAGFADYYSRQESKVQPASYSKDLKAKIDPFPSSMEVNLFTIRVVKYTVSRLYSSTLCENKKRALC